MENKRNNTDSYTSLKGSVYIPHKGTTMTRNKHFDLIRSGSLWSAAWRLSIPAVIAMLLYGLNGLADLIFIGQFCTEASVAGASIAGNFSMFAMGFGSLVGVGIGTVLSLAIGAGDRETQKRVIGNLNALSLIISAIVITIAAFFSEPFMRLMGARDAVLEEALVYFRICLVGTPFIIHGVALNMLVRAEGKMKSAAIMMGSGVILNVLANALLMGIFKLGVAGAAWGTNLGMFVYSAVGIYYIHSGRASFPGKPFALYLDRVIISKALSNGASSLIMSVMTLLQAVIIFKVLASQGSAFDQAFFGASSRIVTFMLTPIFGLMRALQPMIGINYGAADYKRVKGAFGTFLGIATILVLPLWTLMMIFPGQAMSTILPAATLNSLDFSNFRWAISVLPLLPVLFMAMTFFPAIGKGGPVAILGMARQVVLYIPVMLILPARFGIPWVYRGSFLIDSFLILVVIVMVLGEFKRLGTKSK